MMIHGGMVSVIVTVGTSHSAWRLPILVVAELLFLSFFLAFILFPDGRFVPRWTRWLFVVVSILSVVLEIFAFFTNPLAAPIWIGIPLLLLLCTLYASIVIAQIYRYRSMSSLVQRQPTKWVVSGLTATVWWLSGGIVPTLILPRPRYAL